ncbi:hypothetical protein SP90_16145 [Halodesulfovibrio spirochaetisodalis]|uniref:Lysine transporter LysE n=2 Tax=Halodesulfovibrio spirochaetisodalis TaxID=1560234 RepID=A0A1B7X8T2_9BACT|nr:hypothetical protein SP90_16145 [Halodesulfovibrio spirochaetisodalis]
MIVMVTLLAVISPGPDFAVIVRNGLRYGRKLGLATAFGIACGVIVHTTYTLLGLSYILSSYSWVLESVRYAGAAYLIWLGVSAFRPQNASLAQNCDTEESVNITHWAAFRNGFLCNALNPKTMMFFVALFTQVVAPDTPQYAQMGVAIFISLAHLIWFSFIVVALTDERSVTLVNKWKYSFEKVVGVCLVGLGAKLVFDA